MAARRLETSAREFRTLFNVGAVGRHTDGELLARFVVRDGEAAELAFAALIERHGPMVFRVCRQALDCPHDAEDAFQATFVALARRAGSLPDRGPLGPWLYRVACRAAARIRRGSVRRLRHEYRAAVLAPREARDGSDGDPMGTVLHEELSRLPARYRLPMVLCYLEGLTAEQAARTLDWPAGTVRSRLARGRERLRARLAARGLAPSTAMVVAALTPRSAWSAVPAGLAESTVCLATCAPGRFATGTAAAAVISLAEGVLTEMTTMKLKMVAMTVLAACALAGGAAVLAQGSAPGAVAQGQDERLHAVEERLDRLVRDLEGPGRADAQATPASSAPEINRPGVTGLKNRGLAQGDRRDEPHEADRSTIHFPADRAIGVVSTRPRDAKDRPGIAWDRLGEAIGEVSIPVGRQVRLELGAGGRADLSPLRRIGPDQLQSLGIRDADLRGDALVDLAHLTGLEEVNLIDCPIGDKGAQHLAGLRRLKSLAIGGCRVGDEGLARLAELPGLEHLDLGNCWVTEAGLAHVARIRSLRSLSLYRSDIDDRGLAHVGGLPALESLRLAGCLYISDSGLARLAGLARLRRLDLESTPITDAGLEHLAGLEQLEDLNLSHTRITDAGLARLRGLRSLRWLSLPEGLSDAALAHVGAIGSLRELIVRPGRFSDTGIASLTTLDQLQELNLGSGSFGAHVTDRAAGSLVRLPALKRLWLQNTEIGDGGLETLARSRSLERIFLLGNQVTTEGLRHLSAFPALTYLSLAGIRGSSGSLRDLRALKGLTQLSIDGRGWLDRGGDDELAHLSALSRLESLTLMLPITDAGMRHLAGLTALHRLEVDHKDNRITDAGMKYLSGMKSLSDLRVSGWITDQGLEPLEGLRSLYYARLENRPGAISDHAVAMLKARNPSIQVMNYVPGRPGAPPAPTAGQEAPDLQVETFDGQKLRLGELRGKVVLVDFWATWCTPCLADTPKLKAFIDGRRRGQGRPFEAISLNLDEDEHWAKRHVQRNQLSWPQAWVGGDSPTCAAYGVNSAPHYVVIRPDGKIAYAGREFDSATTAANRALEEGP